MELPGEFLNARVWQAALDTRTQVRDEPAVYLLRVPTPFGRLYGQSRIVYIGSTGRLGGSSDRCRLRLYRYPGGEHARKLERGVQRLTDAGQEVTLHWVHLASKAEALHHESALLSQYLQTHGELPPLNDRSQNAPGTFKPARTTSP